jgi:hypothetical protein
LIAKAPDADGDRDQGGEESEPRRLCEAFETRARDEPGEEVKNTSARFEASAAPAPLGPLVAEIGDGRKGCAFEVAGIEESARNGEEERARGG